MKKSAEKSTTNFKTRLWVTDHLEQEEVLYAAKYFSELQSHHWGVGHIDRSPCSLASDTRKRKVKHNTAHHLNVEKPAEFNRIALDFLQN